MDVGRLQSDGSSLPKRSVFYQEAPLGSYYRVIRVQGTVISAKNLPNLDTWSKSDPYCVVKGVRANNNLADIHVTRAINGTVVPFWNEDFAFDCPLEWGQEGLESLRFFVYDSDERYVTFIGSDDFLGGCEVDIQDFTTGQTIEHEFDLEGGPRRKERIFRIKKPKLTPRITVKLAIFRKETPLPDDPKLQLLRSLSSYKQVDNIVCHLFRAKNIAGNDLGNRTDHQCVVRAMMVSGKLREIFRAPFISNLQGWHERFETKFYPDEEPMLLIVDVYDGDGSAEDFTVSGKHVGSAWVSVFEFDSASKRRKLHLHGESQLLETMLTKEGIPIRNALLAGDALLGHTSLSSKSLPNISTRLKRKPTKDTSRSTFYMECTLDMREVEMPHASTLHQPAPIREAHDVVQVLPQFELSRFPVPSELQQLALGERTKPGCMKGRDCIIWVSGTVHGASALSKDLGSNKKGNPYCIVEAMEEYDDYDRTFIHRTQSIKETNYPCWRESFFFAVPEGVHICALLFSVYDDAKGSDGIDDDELYGSVVVELESLFGGYKLQEDLPMSHMKIKPKPRQFPISNVASSNSHAVAFRRYPYLSVEVRCERRVEPYFEIYSSLVAGMKAWERHQVTRQPGPPPSPGGKEFEDASQRELPLRSGAPRQVFNLHVTHQLAELSNRPRLNPYSWLDPPERRINSASSSRPLKPTIPESATQESLEAEQLLQLVRPEVVRPEVCDFSEFRASTPQLVRPASLPELSTSFGRPSSSSSTMSKAWLEGLQFRTDLEEAAGLLTQGMRLKPAVQVLAVPNNASTDRQITTPQKLSGSRPPSRPPSMPPSGPPSRPPSRPASTPSPAFNNQGKQGRLPPRFE